MYVRNLRKPSATKNVYKFASSKNRSVILCESSLERDCCDHLEYSKDVVSFQSQPEGFYYSSGNKLCPYTPDFLVRNLDGSEYFLEVKPLNKTFPEDFKKAFASTRIAAQKLGKPLICGQVKLATGLELFHTFDNLKCFHTSKSPNTKMSKKLLHVRCQYL